MAAIGSPITTAIRVGRPSFAAAKPPNPGVPSSARVPVFAFKAGNNTGPSDIMGTPGYTGTGTGAGAGATGGYAYTPAEIAAAKSIISSLYNPVINEIGQQARQTAANGQSLITGYTNDAVDKLNGINFSQPYDTAETQQNAITAALKASLAGDGGQLESQLGDTLSKAGTDPTLAASLTGKIGSNATGGGNAALAKGDATLSALVNEGTNAATYGKSLPGIQTLAGAQDTSKLQGEVNAQQASQLASIQSKLPGAVQSELGTIANNDAKAAQNTASNNLKQESIDATNRKTDIATIISSNIGPDGKLTPQGIQELKQYGISASGYAGSAGAGVAKANAANQLKTVELGQNQQKIDQGQAKIDLAVKNYNLSVAKLNQADKIAWAKLAQGNRKLAQAAIIAEQKATTMSPDAYSKLLQKANSQADDFYNGIAPTVSSTGVTTKPGVPPVVYNDALQRLVSEGVKVTDAFKILNSRYAEGEGGRPYTVTAGQKAAAVASYPKATG